jgi:tRNA pseudouridine13 synthase
MAVSQRGERGARVGDFKYADGPIDLGMLSGNRFVIALR